MGDLSKNFSRAEFACKCGCGKADISLQLVRMLQEARDTTGVPFVIQSGVRCAKHNVAEGGEKNSAHLQGLAADILCPNSQTRYIMLTEFMRRFPRIGIGATFIHVDIDQTLPQKVAWLYS